jgi:cell division protease FtsH
LGYELAQNREYSEATAARIDRDVQRLLDEAHEEARRCLSAARSQLDQVVELLLKHETVSSAELTQILGSRRAATVPGTA